MGQYFIEWWQHTVDYNDIGRGGQQLFNYASTGKKSAVVEDIIIRRQVNGPMGGGMWSCKGWLGRQTVIGRKTVETLSAWRWIYKRFLREFIDLQSVLSKLWMSCIAQRQESGTAPGIWHRAQECYEVHCISAITGMGVIYKLLNRIKGNHKQVF